MLSVKLRNFYQYNTAFGRRYVKCIREEGALVRKVLFNTKHLHFNQTSTFICNSSITSSHGLYLEPVVGSLYASTLEYEPEPQNSYEQYNIITDSSDSISRTSSVESESKEEDEYEHELLNSNEQHNIISDSSDSISSTSSVESEGEEEDECKDLSGEEEYDNEIGNSSDVEMQNEYIAVLTENLNVIGIGYGPRVANTNTDVHLLCHVLSAITLPIVVENNTISNDNEENKEEDYKEEDDTDSVS